MGPPRADDVYASHPPNSESAKDACEAHIQGSLAVDRAVPPSRVLLAIQFLAPNGGYDEVKTSELIA